MITIMNVWVQNMESPAVLCMMNITSIGRLAGIEADFPNFIHRDRAGVSPASCTMGTGYLSRGYRAAGTWR